MRRSEDDTIALLSRHGSLDEEITDHLDELSRLLPGDGFAVVRGDTISQIGACPPEQEIKHSRAG